MLNSTHFHTECVSVWLHQRDDDKRIRRYRYTLLDIVWYFFFSKLVPKSDQRCGTNQLFRVCTTRILHQLGIVRLRIFSSDLFLRMHAIPRETITGSLMYAVSERSACPCPEREALPKRVFYSIGHGLTRLDVRDSPTSTLANQLREYAVLAKHWKIFQSKHIWVGQKYKAEDQDSWRLPRHWSTEAMELIFPRLPKTHVEGASAMHNLGIKLRTTSAQIRTLKIHNVPNVPQAESLGAINS